MNRPRGEGRARHRRWRARGRVHRSERHGGGGTLGRRRRREGLRKTKQMMIRRGRMLHFVATARAFANVLAAGNEAISKYGAPGHVRGAGLLTDGFELHPQAQT